MKKTLSFGLTCMAFMVVSSSCRSPADPERVSKTTTVDVKYIRPASLVTVRPDLVELVAFETMFGGKMEDYHPVHRGSDGSFSARLSIRTLIKYTLYIQELISPEGNTIAVWKQIWLDGKEAPLGTKVGEEEYEGFVLFKKTNSGEIVFNPTGY